MGGDGAGRRRLHCSEAWRRRRISHEL